MSYRGFCVEVHGSEGATPRIDMYTLHSYSLAQLIDIYIHIRPDLKLDQF